MTIVVYNHKTKEIGSDSMSCVGDTVCPDPAQKLYRVQGGWIGVAGSLVDAWRLLDHINGEDSVNLTGLLVSAIYLPDKGYASCLYVSADGCLKEDILKSSWAVGSGAPFALGALSVGASTRDAVKAGIKYDISCGGKVVIKRRGEVK